MTRSQEAQRKTILLLAAIDMEQVIEAAKAIQRVHEAGTENVQLIRALETAVVVCYWRPFSESNKIGHLSVNDAAVPELHAELRRFRNQVYAHTDTTSGRAADVGHHVTETGEEGLAFTERWEPLPAEWLPVIIDAAMQQRNRFRAEGIALMHQLSGSAAE